MYALRSFIHLIWMVLFVIPTALYMVVMAPFASKDHQFKAAKFFLARSIYGLRWICGVNWRVTGMDNLPGLDPSGKQLPAILLVKHQSQYETFLMPLIMPRPLAYVFKKEILHIPFFGWGIGRLEMIHIDRKAGKQAFVKVVEQGRALLAKGIWIIMFPEGTRSPDGALQTPKPGVGLFACRAQVPVLPVRIFGSFEAFGRSGSVRLGTPVTVVFGRPLAPLDYDVPGAGKERYQLASERIMAAIARLQPPPERVV